jgi:hypothetical protein
LSGPRHGRPNSDPELLAEEKRQLLDDQRQRKDVEGRIVQGKRRMGLGVTREKLSVSQESAISLNMLEMKLEKLLELVVIFIAALQRLLQGKYSNQSFCTLALNPHVATA